MPFKRNNYQQLIQKSIMKKFKNILFVASVLIVLVSSCAGAKKDAPESWAKNRLESLTLEQKVGQLFVYNYIPRFYQQESPSLEHLLKGVEKYHI